MQPFPSPYQPPPYMPPPAKKSNRTWVWVLGGCGCFSILAAAVIVVVFLLLASAGGGGIPADKQAYVGGWSGDGAMLNISPDGRVTWETTEGATTKSIKNAPIQRFIGDDFEVGVAFFSTRFTVQSPPRFDGVRWTMTVEGKRLSRGGGPAGGAADDVDSGGATTTDNLRELKMARLNAADNDMTFTSSFRTSDTKITCVIYPRRLSVGENYGTRWYAERVPRLPANKFIGEVTFPTITPETSQLSGIQLSLTSDDGFPRGLYRVEVLLDGRVVGTTRFTVND